eukprot:1394354-Amorphochlora_amoeboformis.AAC.1
MAACMGSVWGVYRTSMWRVWTLYGGWCTVATVSRRHLGAGGDTWKAKCVPLVIPQGEGNDGRQGVLRCFGHAEPSILFPWGQAGYKLEIE